MKEDAIQILNALALHYGRSAHYNWHVDILFSDEDSILSGEFRNDLQAIILYPNSLCYGPEQLATVINHEYIHYLQSPTWLTRYGNTYEYYDNPYEIEAYKREEEWRKLPQLRKLTTSDANTLVKIAS